MKKEKAQALINENVKNVNPYMPTKALESNTQELFLLNQNENFLGSSPKALKAIAKNLESCFLYPDSSSSDLRKKLADSFKLKPENFIISNGGDDILTMICRAFLNKGDESIYCAPSFGAYSSNPLLMGAKIVEVPQKNFKYDLDAILAKINAKTKLIFICNPNNPTGTIVDKDEVADFMAKVPEHCLVVFDEAYAEYAPKDSFPDTISYIDQEKPVIILRTFSKVYGLAGLREGYAIANEELISILGRVVAPFPVNRMAQFAALAAIDDKEFLAKVLKETKIVREYLISGLENLGLDITPSVANFIWVDVKQDGKALNEKLLAKGFVLRPGYLWGYDNYLRVSLGTKEQMSKFLDVLKELL